MLKGIYVGFVQLVLNQHDVYEQTFISGDGTV